MTDFIATLRSSSVLVDFVPPKIKSLRLLSKSSSTSFHAVGLEEGEKLMRRMMLGLHILVFS